MSIATPPKSKKRFPEVYKSSSNPLQVSFVTNGPFPTERSLLQKVLRKNPALWEHDSRIKGFHMLVLVSWFWLRCDNARVSIPKKSLQCGTNMFFALKILLGKHQENHNQVTNLKIRKCCTLLRNGDSPAFFTRAYKHWLHGEYLRFWYVKILVILVMFLCSFTKSPYITRLKICFLPLVLCEFPRLDDAEPSTQKPQRASRGSAVAVVKMVLRSSRSDWLAARVVTSWTDGLARRGDDDAKVIWQGWGMFDGW